MRKEREEIRNFESGIQEEKIHASIQSLYMNSSTHPPGQQQPSAVARSIVGEANLDPIVDKLMRIGRGNDNISLNSCIGNLGNDIGVGETYNQSGITK